MEACAHLCMFAEFAVGSLLIVRAGGLVRTRTYCRPGDPRHPLPRLAHSQHRQQLHLLGHPLLGHSLPLRHDPASRLDDCERRWLVHN
jgi:hypothetical protein